MPPERSKNSDAIFDNIIFFGPLGGQTTSPGGPWPPDYYALDPYRRREFCKSTKFFVMRYQNVKLKWVKLRKIGNPRNFTAAKLS